MPLVSRTFDQLIDFTRTSAATYVDASGRIVPTPASRNLLTFTQEFDNAGWVKNDTTITANAATAPDGTLTADKLVENTANAEHRAARTETLVAGTYTLSCYVKAAERGFFVFRENINGSIVDTFFNLNTGVVASTGAGRTSSITSAGNGWYRCAVTATSTGGSATLGFDISDNGARIVYTGTAGSGLFLWGAQLEANTTATDYTRNNGGVYPPRFDYDPVTLAPKGLLVEEQRTNLLTYSEQFEAANWSKSAATVTANATTSPDGTVDADKLAETATTSTHYALHFISAVTGTTYAGSIFVKASERSWCLVELGGAMLNTYAFINLSTGAVGTTSGSPTTVSAQSYGNGWWRIVITKTASSSGTGHFAIYPAQADGTASYAGTADSGIFVWGAQLEAGSFATSYIPTVASQVTRTADVATITGANFSQWYNQSAGTFVVEGDYVANVNWRRFMTVDDTAAPANNRIIINGDQNQQLLVTTSGVNQASLNAGTSPSANTVTRIASAYALDNFAAVRDGGTVATDTSGTVPTVNRLNIGLHPNGGEYLNGHIRSLRFFPTRLSNTQLQALTA